MKPILFITLINTDIVKYAEKNEVKKIKDRFLSKIKLSNSLILEKKDKQIIGIPIYKL